MRKYTVPAMAVTFWRGSMNDDVVGLRSIWKDQIKNNFGSLLGSKQSKLWNYLKVKWRFSAKLLRPQMLFWYFFLCSGLLLAKVISFTLFVGWPHWPRFNLLRLYRSPILWIQCRSGEIYKHDVFIRKKARRSWTIETVNQAIANHIKATML